ncbi:MAG: hypothetical protein BWY72_02411 [Bacteroidetes bacterium ADurb.Bin416]|nr:MAG: hypothetical protein BWY72_02411 [Bacteroidetes bacterium ADurb.Bin416]
MLAPAMAAPVAASLTVPVTECVAVTADRVCAAAPQQKNNTIAVTNRTFFMVVCLLYFTSLIIRVYLRFQTDVIQENHAGCVVTFG